MNPAYYGPPPGYPPPQRVQWSNYLPCLVAAIAIIGLAGTLLPMWSVTLDPGDYGFNRYDFNLDEGLVVESVRGTASVDIGFYDWIMSAAPAAAVMPIAFAFAIAITATQLLKGDDRNLWGATSAFALCAIVIVVATAVRPQSRLAVTGPLARELSPKDVASLTRPAPMDVGIGAGLVMAVIALIAVCALSGWLFIAARRGTTP